MNKWWWLGACVYFAISFPAAYSKRNNKAGGVRSEITPGSARPDVTRARDHCWVGPGYRQPCCEIVRVLLVTPGTSVAIRGVRHLVTEYCTVMDGGELVLAIQLLQSTQTMTCFHTASTVCTLATMFVSLSSREMRNMKPGQISVIIRTSHSFHLSQPPNAGFYGDTGSLKIVSAPINLSNENIYMSIYCHVTVVKEYKFSRFNREFSVYSFCWVLSQFMI